jgi:hypothetical protein
MALLRLDLRPSYSHDRHRRRVSAEIWSVNFTAVEALGQALKGTHVELVDYRELPQLIKAKAAAKAAAERAAPR